MQHNTEAISGTDATMGQLRLPPACHRASDGFGDLPHRIPTSHSEPNTLRPPLASYLQRVGVHSPVGIALVLLESMRTDVHVKVILAGPHIGIPAI